MIRNVSWSFLGQGLGILASFIVRIVFIRILGNTYLGLDGLFSNILTVLWTIVHKNEVKMNKFTYFFTNVYRKLGLIVL